MDGQKDRKMDRKTDGWINGDNRLMNGQTNRLTDCSKTNRQADNTVIYKKIVENCIEIVLYFWQAGFGQTDQQNR